MPAGALAAADGAGVLAVTGADGDGVDGAAEGGVAMAGALPAPTALPALVVPCTADVALSVLAAAAAAFAVGAADVAGAGADAGAAVLVAVAGMAVA